MSRYAPRSLQGIARAIDSEVLGLVTTHDADGYVATPLPLLAECDATGAVRSLIGHIARANPHVRRAMLISKAQITFLGPHSYIGRSIVSKPGWAPT